MGASRNYVILKGGGEGSRRATDDSATCRRLCPYLSSMSSPRPLRFAAFLLCATSLLFLPSKKSFSSSSSSSSSSPKSPDPLAAEIAREAGVVKALPDSDDSLKQLKDAVGPALGRAEAALAAGRRMLALQRLAPAFTNVVAAEYLVSLPAATRADHDGA